LPPAQLHAESALKDEEIIEHRQKQFDSFLQERMPVLADFMGLLELPDPAMVLVEADRYLPPLDAWLKDQVISPSDKA
jgi:hypothetical protein